MDEILWCYHLNKISLAERLHSTIHLKLFLYNFLFGHYLEFKG